MQQRATLVEYYLPRSSRATDRELLALHLDEMRLNSENMGVALSDLEPLAYVLGGAIAVLVAILASLAPARRAAFVQPMVAMRSM